MIWSYVKGVEKQLVGENKEQNITFTIRVLLKEEQIGLCHSHSALCKCVFASNVVDGMEDVVVWKIT